MYWGPSIKDYGPAGFLRQAFNRLPNVECARYECHGDPALMGKADLHVCVDWAEDTTDYKDFLPPTPRVYWVSDTHVSPASRAYRMAKAQQCDRVFYNIMTDRADFEKLMSPPDQTYHYWMYNTSSWMPYAVEPQLWRPCPKVEQTYEAVFLGHYANYQERADFLTVLSDELGAGLWIGGDVYLEEAVLKLASGKIIVNHAQSTSTNMRTFEGMSMGGVVLQPWTPDLDALGFVDGVHLLVYRDVDEAIEKIRQYSDQPDERRRIGEQARQAILDRHTYVHRAAQMALLMDMQVTPEQIKTALDTPAAAKWWSDYET